MSQKGSRAFLSLHEALKLPIFNGCRVVGGRGGLMRQVSGVNVMDIPDYYNWIHAGELLVTNCFGIKDDSKALEDFIPTLAHHSLAGVCIKPRRFIEQITPGMIQSADALDFPIIELVADVNFIDITKAVFDALLARQTAFSDRLRSINDMLVNLIAGGSDLNEIARMLSRLTGNSVLITDSVNDRSALHLTELGNIHMNGERPPIDGAYSHSLSVGDKPFGIVYVYPTDTDITKEHKDIVEMLARTIPLEIARERSVRETENVQFNDFMLHLVNDVITNERRDTLRAKSYGFNLGDTHMALRQLVSERHDAQAPYAGALQRALLTSDVDGIMRGLGASCISARDEEAELLILSVPKENAACFADVTRRLSSIASTLRLRYPNLRMHMGCGHPYPGLNGLKRSAKEAKTALKVCTATKGSAGGVLNFADIGLYRLIYSSDPQNEIRAYIDEALGPLLRAKETRTVEFIPMLEGYIRYGGNLKKLSEATFTHYNTVVYRLRRVKELTGLDLRVAEDRFRIETALNLYRLMEMEGL